MICATATDKIVTNDDQPSSTYLDSHAHMAVVGNNVTVVNQTGKCADIRPFSQDLSRMESVPIVDVAEAYDCPYTLSNDLPIACEERVGSAGRQS